MVRDKTFVVAALRSWSDTEASPGQAMARELAQENRVLYVNPPVDWMALLGDGGNRETERKNRVLRGSEPAIRRAGSSLWVLEPPLVVSSFSKIYSDLVFDLLNRRNGRRFAEVIRWAMDHLGMEEHYLLIENDFYRGFYLKEYLDPELTVYYRRFDLQQVDFWRRHGERLEPRLVRKSDLVVTADVMLAEQVRAYNYDTYAIGRGTDLEGFDPGHRYRKPSPLYGIPRPLIGMTAPLSVMLQSPDLLYRIACAFPRCSLVLAGGEDALFSRHGLHRLNNVFFMGAKVDRELPAYVAQFDACISPEARNGHTRASYPDSVVRYLALGKNVVATATDPLFPFGEHLALARSDGHFLELLERALREPPPEGLRRERARFARTFSWRDCVQRLYAVMELVLSEREEEDGCREEELTVS